MSWTYSGRPADNDNDVVRFLVQDIDKDRPFVSNEEIEFALLAHPIHHKAAAMVCRVIAARFSSKASMSVGDVSKSCSDISRAYADRAKELDADTAGIVPFTLPSFGGLSKATKEALKENTDAVQPSFSRGMFEDGDLE